MSGFLCCSFSPTVRFLSHLLEKVRIARSLMIFTTPLTLERLNLTCKCLYPLSLRLPFALLTALLVGG